MAQYKGSVCDESRAKQLIKKREQELQELEQRRKKIESNLHVDDLINKFSTSPAIIVEKSYVKSRIGLLTLNELRENQTNQSLKEENSEEFKLKSQLKILRDENRRKKQTRRSKINKLSFINEDSDDDDNDDDNENNEDSNENNEDNLKEELYKKTKTTEIDNANEETSLMCVTRKRLKKNPNVDTSFLPDRFRDEMEQKIREELRKEWLEKQQKLKDESILIIFSYWDGSGHRRECLVKKGYTVYQFLQKALDTLRHDFHELRNTMSDQLMFVKEDLILPHHYTFYDFIVSKSRGKSGPLFNFDVHDDIRLRHDATIEKNVSHASKVLLRNWYERHKHIFPANRWEPFDPTKTYSKYTISDRKK